MTRRSAASRAVMGLDQQLIDDGTYFIVESAGELAGCGGWSRRATPYGGSHSQGRDDRLLDPATDAALVRAMYTNPSYARRGVGRLILSLWRVVLRQSGRRRRGVAPQFLVARDYGITMRDLPP